MEMKRCKECGKLFMPKSMRQQYCDALHYRPCPVCGKLVEAKYLSDPARCCSNECKKQLASKTRSAIAIPAQEVLTATPSNDSAEIELGRVAEYRGPRVGDWIPGHKYIINIENKSTTYGQYKIWASKDITLDESKKLLLPLSSQNSIDRYFTMAG